MSRRRWALRSVLPGLGATATMDAGAEVVRRTNGVEPLEYRLLARWIGHMGRGRFTHASIADADPVSGEAKLGIVAHYSIGIGFASLLLAWRPGWTERPTPGPAMAMGLGSTAAPWLVMQPAFGLGVAAAKTPDPTRRAPAQPAHARHLRPRPLPHWSGAQGRVSRSE